jgi:DNA-binding CsgD family transcriptional regulator
VLVSVSCGNRTIVLSCAQVSRLTNADLQSVIEMLHDLGADRSGEIFPRPVIERLGELLDSPNAGYCEWKPREADYYIRTFPEPEWFAEGFGRWLHQDAISCHRFRNLAVPVAVSDVLSKRASERVEFYQHTLQAFGFTDTGKLFLPPAVPKARSHPGAGDARFFFFDRDRWGLGSRERALLDLLRPHLTLHREKWRPPPVGLHSLTAREREILEGVSNGETNKQIAKRLWISPYTVRAHLEHIFEKLNVKTRTEAAARLLAAGD